METEKKAGFDASKPFVVPILSGGEKSCEVRFPSDDEWCAWARAQRTVRHFLGRGKSQSEDVDLPKINAELFAKIRTDKDGPEFDDAEAGMVIGRIERCAVASVEREGHQLPDRDEGPRRARGSRAADADRQGDAGPRTWFDQRRRRAAGPSRRARSWSRAARSTTSCTSRTTATPAPCRSCTSRRRCPR